MTLDQATARVKLYARVPDMQTSDLYYFLAAAELRATFLAIEASLGTLADLQDSFMWPGTQPAIDLASTSGSPPVPTYLASLPTGRIPYKLTLVGQDMNAANNIIVSIPPVGQRIQQTSLGANNDSVDHNGTPYPTKTYEWDGRWLSLYPAYVTPIPMIVRYTLVPRSMLDESTHPPAGARVMLPDLRPAAQVAMGEYLCYLAARNLRAFRGLTVDAHVMVVKDEEDMIVKLRSMQQQEAETMPFTRRP